MLRAFNLSVAQGLPTCGDLAREIISSTTSAMTQIARLQGTI